MIAPKRPKLTEKQERIAYSICTDRDENTCQRCGRGGEPQRDHRQGRDPFNTTPANLQLLCQSCHSWKHAHPTQALIDGWSMPRHTTLTPEEWPARRYLRTAYGTRRKAWVLYLDEPVNGRWWIEITDIEAAYRMKKGGA